MPHAQMRFFRVHPDDRVGPSEFSGYFCFFCAEVSVTPANFVNVVLGHVASRVI